MKPAVLGHIEEIRQVAEMQEVVFTGHSAGAAQGTIACSDLCDYCREGELGLELVTFGSPRVGNGEFKKDIESKIEKCTRIVLDRDVVTQAPLSFLGYEHVGKTIQMRDDIILEKEPTWLESLHWVLIGMPDVDLGARDHMPWSYVEEISKWLKCPSADTIHVKFAESDALIFVYIVLVVALVLCSYTPRYEASVVNTRMPVRQ